LNGGNRKEIDGVTAIFPQRTALEERQRQRIDFPMKPKQIGKNNQLQII